MTLSNLRISTIVAHRLNKKLMTYSQIIEDVLKLHTPRYGENPYTKKIWAECTHCIKEDGDYQSFPMPYPCPTVQIIEKELA